MAIPRLKESPKYKDAPRFNLIYVYEGEAKKRYSSSLKRMLSDIDSNIKDLQGNKK